MCVCIPLEQSHYVCVYPLEAVPLCVCVSSWSAPTMCVCIPLEQSHYV